MNVDFKCIESEQVYFAAQFPQPLTKNVYQRYLSLLKTSFKYMYIIKIIVQEKL